MIDPGQKPWWQQALDFVGTRSNWFAPGSPMDQIVPKLPGPTPNNPYNAVGDASKGIFGGIDVLKNLFPSQSRAPGKGPGLAAPVKPARVAAAARVSSRVTKPPKTAPKARAKPTNRGY